MSGKSGERNLLGMRGRRTGGAPAPPPVHHACGSLAASAEGFLTHLAARAYSPPSIEAHRWALKGFVEWAGSQGLTTPASFTRARIEAFQLYLHQYRTPRGGKPLVTNTQLARLGCVRRFFAWLCRSGVIPANPAADLDLPRKQARQLPKAFSAKEIQSLMAIPNTADPFGLRDRAILELFYATGIRRTEMVNLDHGDYDPASLTLTIRKGKGGKSRMLPVGERAAAWLDRFLAESRPLFHHLPQETALFLSGYGTRITPAYIGNWIKGLMKSCGIDKPGSCHLFRHSCATDMHRGGADIRYVQEMLGHARMETTQIYTHVHIDALREIHARTHPHGRLDETKDMYGPIPTAETPEHDLPSPPAENPLQPEAMWVATAPDPEVSAAQAGISNGSCPEPPDEEPPAGGSPCATPKPPPTGGPSSAKSPLDPHEPAQISTKIQRFRPGVTYYGYRWFDSATGRWPSRDPIEESGGFNLYGFVNNNGICGTDHLGLFLGISLDFTKTVELNGCLQLFPAFPFVSVCFGGGWDVKMNTCCKDGDRKLQTTVSGFVQVKLKLSRPEPLDVDVSAALWVDIDPPPPCPQGKTQADGCIFFGFSAGNFEYECTACIESDLQCRPKFNAIPSWEVFGGGKIVVHNYTVN